MKAVHFTAKFNCDDCKKVFNSSEVLETHCRNAHQVKVGTGPILFHNLEAPKSERWFPCNQCDYKSKLKANTEKHKKKHLKSIIKPVHECCHCGKTFKQGIKLRKHLEKCKQFVNKKIGEEDVIDMLSSDINKERIKKVLKIVRKAGPNKVETNLMKTVNESVKCLEKWFISKKITLKDNKGKEYVTAVAYCKDVKGFFKFIKKGRKYKNARFLISADGGMYMILF